MCQCAGAKLIRSYIKATDQPAEFTRVPVCSASHEDWKTYYKKLSARKNLHTGNISLTAGEIDHSKQQRTFS
jgi:hypothetical protein